jgi:predicted nucleotidyltransferase
MLEGSGATPGRDGAVKRPRFPAEKTQAVVEILLDHQPVAVYAFGSQVAGTARADSDLDLAVLLHPGRRLSVEQKMDLTERLGAAVGRDVDLIILNEARLPLQFEIHPKRPCSFRIVFRGPGIGRGNHRQGLPRLRAVPQAVGPPPRTEGLFEAALPED